MIASKRKPWPELPYLEWRDTLETLHLWTQVVGKVRLALTPWLNHSWHVPLYVSARGLATSPIYYEDRAFEIVFDFNRHVLEIVTSEGWESQLPLKPRSVAAFFEIVMAELGRAGINVEIDEHPTEIPDAIPFSRDTVHVAYDRDFVHRFWQALLQADRVLKRFRTGFIGKCSPVHFFWGSFDLAVTRFSGRRAPMHPGGVPGLSDAVVREAYSHEVSSAGFWPGGGGIEYPTFYSYTYPEPKGFRTSAVEPGSAFFSPDLREFLVPYDAVRSASDPDAALLAFLQSTYEAAASNGNWDRAALERPLGLPGTCPAGSYE
jgi:hypothetical protein